MFPHVKDFEPFEPLKNYGNEIFHTKHPQQVSSNKIGFVSVFLAAFLNPFVFSEPGAKFEKTTVTNNEILHIY